MPTGCKIPLASRILALADAFDALTQDRIYRKAMTTESALEEIAHNGGIQFDPDITDAFLVLIGEKKECGIQRDNEQNFLLQKGQPPRNVGISEFN